MALAFRLVIVPCAIILMALTLNEVLSHPTKNWLHCTVTEVYDYCNAHCQVTCGNKDGPLRCDYRICQPGCVCLAGLVRHHSLYCVKPNGCKSADEKWEQDEQKRWYGNHIYNLDHTIHEKDFPSEPEDDWSDQVLIENSK